MFGCRAGSIQQGKCRKKQRGDSLARDRPCFPNFRRPGSVPRSQLIVTPKLFGTYEFEPAFPVPRCEIRCKSSLVPSAATRSPECCVSLISDSLASLVSDSLAGLISAALPSSVAGSLPNLGSILIRSSFPGALADSDSGSPGVPFPDLFRVPLPVLRWLVFYSLLLEDFSSVDS